MYSYFFQSWKKIKLKNLDTKQFRHKDIFSQKGDNWHIFYSLNSIKQLHMLKYNLYSVSGNLNKIFFESVI